MKRLRKVQIGMDKDVASKIADEEKMREIQRQKQLEDQAKKDEEFVRQMLLQEQKQNKKKKKSKIQKEFKDKQLAKQYSFDKNHDQQHQNQNIDQLMQISNANGRTTLSQQIASVAIKQQQERLMGGKQKKSVLDLWIKSQMQLMCGQLPTLCKKYGIPLNRLENMYGNKIKRSFQPEVDQYHYLKFRDEHYDPNEFKETKQSNKINPLL
eukprot:270780_1